MSDEKRPWTLDSSARASSPGRVKVNPLRWYSHYPEWPVLALVGLGISVVVARFVEPIFWSFAGALVLFQFLYWKRVREHFWHGCINPAIVVSVEPMLIAALTDLSKGTGEYPAIKIIRKSLDTVCGQAPQIGSRLATVSLYQDGPDRRLPRWYEFHPRPVECATGDMEVIQRVMSTLSEEDWSELQSYLRQVPQPFRPGLFLLEPHRSP